MHGDVSLAGRTRSRRLGQFCPFDEVIRPLCSAEKVTVSAPHIEQDRFGFRSQERGFKAIRCGLFKEEILPIILSQKKGQIVFDFGDEADGVYLIIDGQFELVTKVDIEPS